MPEEFPVPSTSKYDDDKKKTKKKQKYRKRENTRDYKAHKDRMRTVKSYNNVYLESQGKGEGRGRVETWRPKTLLYFTFFTSLSCRQQ